MPNRKINPPEKPCEQDDKCVRPGAASLPSKLYVPRDDPDLDGVEHCVTVTASTLYEAVALGLAALRGKGWVAGIAEGMSVVKVLVVQVPVEHRVAMRDFRSWLERPPRSPRDIAQRARIREILGIGQSRAK